jgi:hypothetical protein
VNSSDKQISKQVILEDFKLNCPGLQKFNDKVIENQLGKYLTKNMKLTKVIYFFKKFVFFILFLKRETISKEDEKILENKSEKTMILETKKDFLFEIIEKKIILSNENGKPILKYSKEIEQKYSSNIYF